MAVRRPWGAWTVMVVAALAVAGSAAGGKAAHHRNPTERPAGQTAGATPAPAAFPSAAAAELLREGDRARADGRLEQAVEFYLQAGSLAPTDPAAWSGLAAACVDAGDLDCAARARRTAARVRRGDQLITRGTNTSGSPASRSTRL